MSSKARAIGVAPGVEVGTGEVEGVGALLGVTVAAEGSFGMDAG